jgi:hypothetical protein
LGLSRFIVAILAVALAIFPIAGAGAGSPRDHHAQLATTVHHDHNSGTALDAGFVESDAEPHNCASSANGNEHGKQHPTSGCCGMGACHALAFVSSPIVASPTSFRSSLALRGDEQVRGQPSAPLDRPPRTV